MIRYTFRKVTRPTWSMCSVIVQLHSVIYKYTVYVKWRPCVCDYVVVTWRQKWPGIVVKTSWQARCSKARSRRTCRPTNCLFWSVPRWAHDGKIQSAKPSWLQGSRKVARMASTFPAVPGNDQPMRKKIGHRDCLRWAHCELTMSSPWAHADQNGHNQPWLSRDLGRDWAVT